MVAGEDYYLTYPDETGKELYYNGCRFVADRSQVWLYSWLQVSRIVDFILDPNEYDKEKISINREGKGK